jgi:hypothetical protein
VRAECFTLQTLLRWYLTSTAWGNADLKHIPTHSPLLKRFMLHRTALAALVGLQETSHDVGIAHGIHLYGSQTTDACQTVSQADRLYHCQTVRQAYRLHYCQTVSQSRWRFP